MFSLLLIFMVSASAEAATVTFEKDVKPIFQNRCFQCHKGSNPNLPKSFHYPNDVAARMYPPDWTVYENAFNYRSGIQAYAVTKLTMPPNNVTLMTDGERAIVDEWVNTGAKNDAISGLAAPLAKGEIPTFTTHIKPIIESKCLPCHTSLISFLPNWRTYKTAFQFRNGIYQRTVVLGSMPPGNSPQLTQAERDRITLWVKSGAKG